MHNYKYFLPGLLAAIITAPTGLKAANTKIAAIRFVLTQYKFNFAR